MEAPRPGAQHARLAALAGDWRGTDSVQTPDGPPAHFAGRYRQRVDLDGWFLALEYEQEMDGAVHYRMRAVLGWHPGDARYFMHWYDSFGGMNTDLRGDWEGDWLVLSGPDPQDGGLSRFSWRVTSDRMTLSMDVSSDGGASWVRRLDGSYTRER